MGSQQRACGGSYHSHDPQERKEASTRPGRGQPDGHRVSNCHGSQSSQPRASQVPEGSGAGQSCALLTGAAAHTAPSPKACMPPPPPQPPCKGAQLRNPPPSATAGALARGGASSVAEGNALTACTPPLPHQQGRSAGGALGASQRSTRQQKSSQNSGMLELLRSFDDGEAAERDASANDECDEENVLEGSENVPQDSFPTGHGARHATQTQRCTVHDSAQVVAEEGGGGVRDGATLIQSGGVARKRRKDPEKSDSAAAAAEDLSCKRHQGEGDQADTCLRSSGEETRGSGGVFRCCC